MQTIKCLLPALFLFGSTVLLAQPAFTDNQKFPEGVIGKRIQAVLDALNNGEAAAVTGLLEQHCTVQFRNEVPFGQHLEVFKNTNRRTGGVDFFSVRSYNPPREGVTFIFKDRLLGAWRGCTMYLDGPEQRIGALEINPARTPQIAGAAGEPLSEAGMIGLLKEKMTLLSQKDVFSGTVLVAKADKVLYEYACGEATKSWHVPNNIDTKFNLGSMNKMFTSVAVMQLVEQGKVKLEDPIGKYVDESWLPRSITDRIKVEHLLTHTSGLGSYFNDTYERSSRELFRDVDDYKILVRGDTLAFEPGARFEYSNTGMLLLGVVIEKASGIDYFEYIRQHIYQLAGMNNSDCYPLDRPHENLAEGYLFASDGNWKNNLFMHVLKGGPAGGGYSTVRDLHRFALALQSGKLISKVSLDKMWTDYIGAGYGYGFSIQEMPGGKIVGHGGGFPGLNSGLDIYLNQGYIVVVMSNYDMGAEPVKEYIRNLIMTRLK